jgi:uncharacterized protein YegJ (DUF2314 family)
MLDFLRRRLPCVGSALFRGTVPPRLEEFTGLSRRGVVLEPAPVPEGALWAATLRHPEWGRAHIVCPRDTPTPDPRLLRLDPKLGEEDVHFVGDCSTSVALEMKGTSDFVLRDRKRMLRFLHVLMGDEGVAAVDHTSGTFWMHHALDDELSHDADLDVESIFLIHAVRDEESEQVTWFHTHGLGELGRFDFDILTPHPEFVDHCGDFTRAMAFAILEGHATPGMDGFEVGHPLFPMNLVPVDRFAGQARPEAVAVRDDPHGDHVKNRVVVCEPSGGGLVSRLLGRTALRPARGFERPLPESVVLNFSNGATGLMAERARKTYPVLQEIAAEMAEFELPVLVKIGYVVDGGGPDEREHLWFMVHDMRQDTIDATLANQPYEIARMNEGDRGDHPVEQLTDWMVLTPYGPINPHAFHARRFINADRDGFRRLVDKARTSPPVG